MSQYPPSYHVDDSRERAFAVVRAFPFASLISCASTDPAQASMPLVTQLPLMLRGGESDGNQATQDYRLVGHIDANNPQVQALEQRWVKALFHGPETYLSPLVAQPNYLPTWNYISVQISGRVRLVHDAQWLAESIVHMTKTLEGEASAYELSADDPRVQNLLPYIVGFEMSIVDVVGRFKLSKDKPQAVRQRAADYLVDQSHPRHAELIQQLAAPNENKP